MSSVLRDRSDGSDPEGQLLVCGHQGPSWGGKAHRVTECRGPDLRDSLSREGDGPWAPVPSGKQKNHPEQEMLPGKQAGPRQAPPLSPRAESPYTAAGSPGLSTEGQWGVSWQGAGVATAGWRVVSPLGVMLQPSQVSCAFRPALPTPTRGQGGQSPSSFTPSPSLPWAGAEMTPGNPAWRVSLRGHKAPQTRGHGHRLSGICLGLPAWSWSLLSLRLWPGPPTPESERIRAG